jgi:hypothetical protein
MKQQITVRMPEQGEVWQRAEDTATAVSRATPKFYLVQYQQFVPLRDLTFEFMPSPHVAESFGALNPNARGCSDPKEIIIQGWTYTYPNRAAFMQARLAEYNKIISEGLEKLDNHVAYLLKRLKENGNLAHGEWDSSVPYN